MEQPITFANMNSICCIGAFSIVALAHHYSNKQFYVVDTVDQLAPWNQPVPPFWEPQLPDLLLAHRNVKLHFHNNIQQFIRQCPLIFIAIEMRTKKKRRIEIDKWMEVVRLIRDNAAVSKYIIDKSDVSFDVRNTIMDVIQPTQVVHRFYTNPEFFSHGSAFDTLLNPRRVVFGHRTPYANLTLLHHIYNFVPKNNRLVINDARSVDFTKIYCNALLGFMGTLANIGSTFADDLNIDINQVFRIVDSEDRLGHSFLEPNVAVGGPALQRDIAYMAYMAEEGGHKEIAALFKGFIEVNKKRKEKFEKKMLKCMHSLTGKTIVILGFAYKEGTEDMSDSPLIYICEQLMRNEDVTLRVHDPIVSDEIIK